MQTQSPIFNATLPDKTIPQAAEAEEALLGSILIEPDVLRDLDSPLSADDFFLVRNRWVWQAIKAVEAKGQQINNLTVGEQLKHDGHLEDIGGYAYLTSLMNNTPNYMHASTFAGLVYAASTRRHYMSACQRIGQMMLDQSGTVEEVIEKAEKIMFDLRIKRLNERRDIRSIGEVADTVVETIEKAKEQPAKWLSVGIHDVDRMKLFVPEEITTIGARPGMGKSQVAVQFATHIAKTDPVLFFSLEMSAEQLTTRYLSAESHINNQLLRGDILADEHWPALVEAQMSAASLKMFIDDTPDLTIRDIRARARQFYGVLKPRLIIIDFLQLLVKGFNETSVHHQILQIMIETKNMVRELNCSALMLSQLGRDVDDRKDKRPHLNDYKESGAIEELSGIAGFLYREDFYNDNSERQNQIDLYTEKNRHGPLMHTTLFNHKEESRVSGMAKPITIDLREL